MTFSGTAGETVTAGMPVYLKAADGRYWKADADASSATGTVVGLCVANTTAGNPITVVISGSVNLGVALTVGAIYILSATAGGIAPVADLASTWYASILGVASTAALLDLHIVDSGVAHA